MTSKVTRQAERIRDGFTPWHVVQPSAFRRCFLRPMPLGAPAPRSPRSTSKRTATLARASSCIRNTNRGFSLPPRRRAVLRWPDARSRSIRRRLKYSSPDGRRPLVERRPRQANEASRSLYRHVLMPSCRASIVAATRSRSGFRSSFEGSVRGAHAHACHGGFLALLSGAWCCIVHALPCARSRSPTPSTSRLCLAPFDCLCRQCPPRHARACFPPCRRSRGRSKVAGEFDGGLDHVRLRSAYYHECTGWCLRCLATCFAVSHPTRRASAVRCIRRWRSSYGKR